MNMLWRVVFLFFITSFIRTFIRWNVRCVTRSMYIFSWLYIDIDLRDKCDWAKEAHTLLSRCQCSVHNCSDAAALYECFAFIFCFVRFHSVSLQSFSTIVYWQYYCFSTRTKIRFMLKRKINLSSGWLVVLNIRSSCYSFNAFKPLFCIFVVMQFLLENELIY